MALQILAIETSTAACSAALCIGGEVLERYALAPRQHAALILPMIESVLAEAGIGVQALDALAFGRGPGAFTGVRIAAGIVQGIAFAAELPVVPVSTLAALAPNAARTSRRDGSYSRQIGSHRQRKPMPFLGHSTRQSRQTVHSPGSLS